uniref:hypothetical protein n=1 Tax=uncultured Thiodictyon sp. TaxID=1846217 RepID=UPI0025F1A208
ARTTSRTLREAIKESGATVIPGRDDRAEQGFRIKDKAQTWKVTAPLIDRHLADRDWVVIRVLAD